MIMEGNDIMIGELLLLHLCRLSFTNEQVDKINKLISGISDWQYFINKANEHGVIALVYHNLDKLGLLQMAPSEIVSALNNKLMVNISRNAFHATAIKEIHTILAANNIRFILLKGMALEFSDYGNSGLRQMTDMDILIEPGNYKKTCHLMVENGFISLPVKSIFHKPIIALIGKHLPSFIKNGASIDIHLELFPGLKNDLTRQLFDYSREIKINDQDFLIPPPQLFFLYLVHHLWSHEINGESQLRLYTDLVVLLEKHKDEIISDSLISYASASGLSEVLASKLMLLKEFWGISFNESINSFIEQWYNRSAGKDFLNFLHTPKNGSGVNRKLIYRKTIQEIPGFHNKCLYVIGDVLPSLTFMKERYGCRNKLTSIFYYPHRLGKILWLLR
jgi:hypothetical protein